MPDRRAHAERGYEDAPARATSLMSIRRQARRMARDVRRWRRCARARGLGLGFGFGLCLGLVGLVGFGGAAAGDSAAPGRLMCPMWWSRKSWVWAQSAQG